MNQVMPIIMIWFSGLRHHTASWALNKLSGEPAASIFRVYVRAAVFSKNLVPIYQNTWCHFATYCDLGSLTMLDGAAED
jgi:hypothetical protein